MEENKTKVDELEKENIDDTDLEDEDSKKEIEKKSEKESKKPQSREENAKYAELRRRNKELQDKVSDLEVKASKADFNAEKKVIKQSTLDDLGLESIEDEDDLLLCKEYEKAEKRGSDNPVKDANLAYRAKIRARRAEVEKQEESDKKMKEEIQKDAKEFYETYKITPAEAFADNKFMEAYGDLIEGGNLTKLYGKYKALTKVEEDEEDEDSKKAKKMGVIPTTSKKTSSKSDLLELEGSDFLEAFNKKYKG